MLRWIAAQKSRYVSERSPDALELKVQRVGLTRFYCDLIVADMSRRGVRLMEIRLNGRDRVTDISMSPAAGW